jgi:hypothetical protein
VNGSSPRPVPGDAPVPYRPWENPLPVRLLHHLGIQMAGHRWISMLVSSILSSGRRFWDDGAAYRRTAGLGYGYLRCGSRPSPRRSRSKSRWRPIASSAAATSSNTSPVATAALRARLHRFGGPVMESGHDESIFPTSLACGTVVAANSLTRKPESARGRRRKIRHHKASTRRPHLFP